MNAIAVHIGRSTATVSNAIQRLKQRGAIQRINHGHRLSKGVYRLLTKSVQNPSNRIPTPASMGIPANPTPDVYRSNAFGMAGRLHLRAPKEQLLTMKELLGLDIIRTRATILKHVSFLADLPIPLVSVTEDPTRGTRKLYTFHSLTNEREQSLWSYLSAIPKGEPITREQHARRAWEKQRNYAQWLRAGGIDPEQLWAEVKPSLIEDCERPGCFIPTTAEIDSQGYSILCMGRLTIRVHRLAYEAQCGQLTFGEELHHRCGNRACVEVFHLEPVTREQHLAIHRAM
ncbi:HNH endonuclease signature motif containing protein [Glutamicibacter sp. NPDC127525]|uniref:HNH endonuclease signature motif containing protein n=1 Tax=unclassified Glutamicibacter TaxID=2627139 RepID=UPI00363A2961